MKSLVIQYHPLVSDDDDGGYRLIKIKTIRSLYWLVVLRNVC